MRKDALLAVCIGVVAIVVTAGSWGATTRWHPDSLFYEARLLEVQGVEAQVALDRVLSGPLAEGVSAVVQDPEWVEYNRDFYRRRWIVPALGAVVEPAFGTDSLQLVSLIGYALIGPLLFLLLRRRFGVLVSATRGVDLYRASLSSVLVRTAPDGQLRGGVGDARPARGRARPRPGPTLAAVVARDGARPGLHS